MKLTSRSTLAETASVVGEAMRAAGIRGVLTGGGCASVQSDGVYTSRDLDFVLDGPTDQNALDAALAAVGYVRRKDRYVHPRCPFWLEFPPGPLGIGSDIAITPAVITVEGRRILALSPTDACRDRLAAFYHWDDRQSLDAAVAIARRHRLNHARIRAWSGREGAAAKYAEFVTALAEARRQNRRGDR